MKTLVFPSAVSPFLSNCLLYSSEPLKNCVMPNSLSSSPIDSSTCASPLASAAPALSICLVGTCDLQCQLPPSLPLRQLHATLRPPLPKTVPAVRHLPPLVSSCPPTLPPQAPSMS